MASPRHSQPLAPSTSTLSAERLQMMSDTYRLLAMTLLFSAAMAAVAIQLQVPYLGLWMLIPYFVLLFIVQAKQDKPSGLIWTFLFTGWLGFSMGPIVNFYLATANGTSTVLSALAATGLTFLGASLAGRLMPAVMSRIYGMLALAILVAFVVALANALFFAMPALSLFLSGAFAVLSTLVIASVTGRIVRGEETSYIVATVTIFVMLWNLFSFFLQIFANRE